MKFGCIILAGGKSSRMGEDKALLNYKGQYFIEKITEELSFFDEKIIARGNNSNLAGIVDSNWKLVSDLYLNHGPMGGLHAALSKCESEAMFVVTCDMPLITANLARKICCEMTMEGKTPAYDAVIAVSEDGKYHPLCGVYKKELYQSMEEHLCLDNNRIRAVLSKHNVKYLELNAEDSKQLANVNTREEYEVILQRMCYNKKYDQTSIVEEE